MANGESVEVSVGDIIDALDGFVDLNVPVDESEVIESLHLMKLTGDELKHILRVCEKGKQQCLSQRINPSSYVAIISYVQMRLSTPESL